MSRRGPYITTRVCAQEGCNERQHFSYRTLADQRDAQHFRKGMAPWKCSRHNRPEQVLTPDNLERTQVCVAEFGKGKYIEDKLFWTGDGADGTLTSGFTFGPGFKAYAKDFPPGTRLVITARIEMPE